ncbi:MAG: DeoR/GlpR family DNA-binding transcription regulator [Bifidobacteriaceae bacterium]|nr:DeoR/GlpR family DNA-binding transcription regulator [Bifidobacteriaceae bacterium]
MLSTTRHATILKRLQADGEVSVHDLAEQLDVSPATIRRDLDALSARGALRRVRGGGAGLDTDTVTFEEVAQSGGTERDALAKAAAALIPEDCVIVLDMGTTTARLAHHLRGRSLTVVTASIAVVHELEECDQPEVVVLGGALRRSYRSLVGSLTTDALTGLHTDMGFISMSGIRPDGWIMDDTGMEAPIKRAIIGASDRTVAVAAARKFPGTGLVAVAPPEAIATLVTSTGADPATLNVIADAGTEVIAI